MPYSLKNKQPVRKSSWIKRPPVLILAGVAVVALTLGVLEATNTTHVFHKAVTKTAVIRSTSPAPAKPSPKTTATTTTPAPTDTTTTPAPTTGSATKGSGDSTPAPPAPSGVPPVMPSGSFVSNHNPDISGNPYPSAEQSVCTTTPGATCGITFTNGSLTRTLATQTTNYDGSTYWTWDVKQAGFTAGTWTVTVTATLNGQTATAHDTLKVGP